MTPWEKTSYLYTWGRQPGDPGNLDNTHLNLFMFVLIPIYEYIGAGFTSGLHFNQCQNVLNVFISLPNAYGVSNGAKYIFRTHPPNISVPSLPIQVYVPPTSFFTLPPNISVPSLPIQVYIPPTSFFTLPLNISVPNLFILKIFFSYVRL